MSDQMTNETETMTEFWHRSYEFILDHAQTLKGERDGLNKQIAEWRGTIRETGHDGARELVQAYKAKKAEVFKLRALLSRVQSGLSALDTGELAREIDEILENPQ